MNASAAQKIWIKEAISDLYYGSKQWRIWTALAWVSLKVRYSRSVLGLLWIPCSFAIFLGAKFLIFGSLFGREDSTYFALYLTSGFFVWQLASISVSSAANTFTTSQGFIRNDALPLSIYVFKDVSRELLDTALTTIVVVAVFLFYRPTVTFTAVLCIAAMLLIIANMIWVKLLIGVIATRYRDVGHLIQAIMRVMMFLTPIFWMPDQVGAAMVLLWWNPFFHVLEIFRAPLIDNQIAFESWVYLGVVTLVGWTSALVVYGQYRWRIAFWL